MPEKKQMRRTLVVIGVCLLALTAAAGTMAAPQGKKRCTLGGTVIGPDDKPVPHAVHTNSRGQFAISNLKADNYDIRASAKGIFSEWEKNVNLRPGQTKTIELRLIYAKEMPTADSKAKPKP